ncbi:MAG: DMT family transporter [Sandaracinaceae bacterium]|nr:DMT family transporter [Sandaracinaceae bacterium]
MHRGIAQVALAAVLWGTWSLYLRPTGLPGTVTAPIVLVVIGVTGLVLIRGDRAPPRWDRTTWLLLVAYAALDAINAGAFFGAMQVTTVAVAVLTHCTAPVLVALLAPRIDGARVPGSLVAAMVALAGLVLLLRPWASLSGDLAAGAALGGASAIAYASLVFVGRALAARIGVGRATAYHALLAAPLFLPFVIPELHRIEAIDLAWLSGGALLNGTLATWLFLDALGRIGSARAAVLTFLEPTVAVLVGWIAFGEALEVGALAGGVLVLGAGLYVSSQ